MSSTKRPALPIFLINAKGQLFRLTRTKPYLAEASPTNRTIGPWLHSVLSRTIMWTDAEADGTRKRSTRNGSARSSRRKTGSGKRGG